MTEKFPVYRVVCCDEEVATFDVFGGRHGHVPVFEDESSPAPGGFRNLVGMLPMEGETIVTAQNNPVDYDISAATYIQSGARTVHRLRCPTCHTDVPVRQDRLRLAVIKLLPKLRSAGVPTDAVPLKAIQAQLRQQ